MKEMFEYKTMALDLNPNIGWKLYNQIGVEGKKKRISSSYSLTEAGEIWARYL